MAGKYQAYPDYRDSEVNWLGKVPSHWVVSKFGYVKTVLTDYTANGSFADLKKNVVYRDEPSHARLVRLTDLRVNLENQNGVWIDEDAYNYLGKSALFGGEFLLANVGAYAGLFYQMPEDKGNASLAPNMFMAKFDGEKILREFMAYVGQSQSANEQLRLNATASSAQPKLNKDDFKSVRFTYPALDEQEKIANFLDHETAKIDTLIEKQQQLIKLLKEKRQAVISHAVTKGLNPNAPMRDSGVEWLGEVPEHWELSKVKFLVELTPKKSEVEKLKSENCSFIPMEKLKQDLLVLDEVKEIGEVYDGYTYFKDEDLLIAKVTPCFENKNMVVARGLNNGVGFGSTEIYVLRSRLVNLNDFLYYRLQEDVFMEMATGSMTGAGGLKRVPSDFLNDYQLALPPEKERLEIVTYIREYVFKFDELMQQAENAIALMQERRTALISAAVTGKIDVRNWVAPSHLGNCSCVALPSTILGGRSDRDISASMHVTTPEQQIIETRK